jgi:hypothetical protein
MGCKLGRSEEDGRESTGAIIHTCMGTSQGNSLYSYFYLNVAKCHISCFIFYLVGEQEGGTG